MEKSAGHVKCLADMAKNSMQPSDGGAPDSQVVLNFQTMSLPPLSPKCLETLSTPVPVGKNWTETVSWTYSERTKAIFDPKMEARTREVVKPPRPEGAPGRQDDLLKCIKVDTVVWQGLCRLAERLGCVHGPRGNTPYGPNVSALLRQLALGEAFTAASPFGASLASIQGSDKRFLNQVTVHLEKALADAITEVNQSCDALANAQGKLAPDLRVAAAASTGSVVFADVYWAVLNHPGNTEDNHPDWPLSPTQRNPEFHGPFQRGTSRWEMPSNILGVCPESLRERVAENIRQRMNSAMSVTVELLCSAWGFSESAQDGLTAFAWQFSNKRSRNLVGSASKLVRGLKKVPALAQPLLSVAKSHPQGGVREVYRSLFPRPKQEVLMMAATGTTYRSRIGYKRICPWRAWPGSDVAVQTKHAIYNDIREVFHSHSSLAHSRLPL
eukprot:1923481-Rhodomonas_salina.1